MVGLWDPKNLTRAERYNHTSRSFGFNVVLEPKIEALSLTHFELNMLVLKQGRAMNARIWSSILILLT